MNWPARGNWTDERIERLRQLLGEGLSASQVAKELGGISRNAVIGKAARMGFAFVTIFGKPKPRPRPRDRVPPSLT